MKLVSKREIKEFVDYYDLTIPETHNYCLSNGMIVHNCGVGFDQFVGVLNGFTNPVDIEIIKSTRKDRGVDNNKERFYHRDGKRVWHLTVGDSGVAWAKAAGKLLAMKKPVDIVILDFSEIRPGGKPLKGFGWISSGDVQISESFYEICKILSEKHGQLLSRINILDIMNWFGMALSSRRAAEIALCPVDDPEAEEFISAKKDYWKVGKKQRGMSNNTVMFYRKPSKSELRGIFHQMMEAGGSEPGFLNVQAAKKRAPWFATVNPCCEILLGNKSFCVSGDTKLITKSGITTIRDAVGQEIEIWNGNEWTPVTPFKTGDADELIRVSFNDGSYLDVTENHRFFVASANDVLKGNGYREVLAKDLSVLSRNKLHTEPFSITELNCGEYVAEAYTYGFYVGDGYNTNIPIYTAEKRKLPLAGVFVDDGEQNKKKKWRCRSLNIDTKLATELKHDISPVFSWDRNSIINFVSGLADADGSNTQLGAIRIYQGSEEFIRSLQLLLTKVGIKSSVNFMTDKDSNFGRRTKAIWYLQITNVTDLKTHRLSNTYSGSGANGKGTYQIISKLERLPGTYESFCFTEPKTGKGVFGNTLTGQCNLSTIPLNKYNGDYERLKYNSRLIARANYRQTCVDLRDGILQDTWHELNEFLRLTGMSACGVVGWEYHQDANKVKEYADHIREAVHEMADELGLPRSKAITTIKPEGTLGKLLDTTEGIHKPLAKYIFNRIIVSKHSPIIDAMRSANYRIEEHPFDSTSYLVVMPIAFEDVEFDTVTKMIGDSEIVLEVNNESAVSQLERYKLWMDNYADHNVSNTISYSPEEVPEIVNWLHQNWDHYVGVSFIYRTDPTKTAGDLGYAYLPQQPVSKEQYYEYVNSLIDIDLDNVFVNSLEELEDGCTGGVCPIR